MNPDASKVCDLSCPFGLPEGHLIADHPRLMDKLAEIEERVNHNPAIGATVIDTSDIRWLIEEVKRLRAIVDAAQSYVHVKRNFYGLAKSRVVC